MNVKLLEVRKRGDILRVSSTAIRGGSMGVFLVVFVVYRI